MKKGNPHFYGYDRDLFAEHPEGFQSPGDLYAAQENYDPNKKREELKCSVKADGYAIGILLASVWTKSCYEKDAVTGTGADGPDKALPMAALADHAR